MFDGIDWSKGKTVIAASGPSLTQHQVDLVRGRARLLVVNNCHELAPWADAIYACDYGWWNHYGGSVTIKNRWTMVPEGNPTNPLAKNQTAAAEKFGLRTVPGKNGKGLGRGGVIHWGSNSGYQAVNLAYLFGARRIILIGYDFKDTNGKKHWHADHPVGMNKAASWHNWSTRFCELYEDLKADGVSVINATVDTALGCVPRRSLSAALEV